MKNLRKIFKGLAYLIGVVLIAFILVLLKATFSDYKPPLSEPLAEHRGEVIYVSDTFRVFNWNIGYCGLGDDMSFFYDGGSKVRTSAERTEDNLVGIIEEITAVSDVDFYFLQEVDVESKRSYRINQYEELQKALKGYNASFAHNYKVWYVPVPVSNPYGKIEGGLASFSKHEPFSAYRYSYPSNYSWPMGLFMLDRCFMVQRFYTSNGKELVLINTHNSAYDDGSLRSQQMELLANFIKGEYAKGNYVVVGGDWNQLPPKEGVEASSIKNEHLTTVRIASDFMPEAWSWVYSDSIPTNRLINDIYRKDTTKTYTIDFYLLSPNVKPLHVENIDLQFKHSDHQPVFLKFVLKP